MGAEIRVRLLPAAEDADDGDIDDADGWVMKSPASGVLAGLLVGVMSLWSGWWRWGYSSRISLTAARAAGSSTRDVPVA
jgi:hypothetical protein